MKKYRELIKNISRISNQMQVHFLKPLLLKMDFLHGYMN